MSRFVNTGGMPAFYEGDGGPVCVQPGEVVECAKRPPDAPAWLVPYPVPVEVPPPPPPRAPAATDSDVLIDAARFRASETEAKAKKAKASK